MERRKAHDAKELRDLSRQMYLTKREQQKLDELRDKIEDEERLFAVRPVARASHVGKTLLHMTPQAGTDACIHVRTCSADCFIQDSETQKNSKMTGRL